MQCGDMTAEQRDKEMEGLVTEAQMHLEKHQLEEAEELLCKVLQQLTETNPERERLGISTLLGLAEIYAKRGRSRRYNLMEWYRLLMQSATFQEEAQVLCQKVLSEPCASVPLPWLIEAKNKSSVQLNALEERLTNTLHDNVKRTQAARRVDADPDEELHVGWLKYLKNYCCETQGLQSKLETTESDLAHAHDSDELNNNSQRQTVVHRKINFDQVQQAIMTLVKEITADLRRRSWRRRLPEETLKRSLSSEMINKLSPTSEHTDIISMFENAIIYEETEKEPTHPDEGSINGDKHGETEDEAYLNDPYPMEILHTKVNIGALKSGDHQYQGAGGRSTFQPWTNHPQSSKQSTSGIPSGIESTTKVSQQVMAISSLQAPQSRVKEYLPRSLSSDPMHPVHPHVGRSLSCPQELDQSTQGYYAAGPYNLPGILTVWRSYKKPQSLRQSFRKYTLTSFEEMSPLTETGKFFEPPEADTEETNSQAYLDQNLLSEDRMKGTLGCMIAKVAERLQNESKFKEALELFKFSMGLFQEIPASQLNANVIGNILKLVGMMKCQQGDTECGIQLMEEAMAMYGAEEEDSVEVAEVLYEMGNAYMAEHWKDASLFDHVMRLVKSDVDNDIQLDLSPGDMDNDSDSDSECSDSGESYTVCTAEAMGCYHQALAILSNLQEQNEQHTSLYVDVLTKLADCCIMVSDYDRAILCYEEALYLFRNALGAHSLPNNAHVLSMLGTANFLLANYPKAVSMYETANILQKHLHSSDGKSFGSAFNLTMLGLTFYTMKQYQKCIQWCLRAYDAYKTLFTNLISVKALKQWFIVQTLYTLGFSYSTLNFYDNALHYLELSKDLMKKIEDRDSKQMVRILKSMADVYHSIDDHEKALECYNEALDESHRLGDEKTVNALQNQLLNKIAVVHVTTKHYDTAADFLEKALDYQKNVQSSIRGDLLGMMHQLGMTYTLSGDIDKAIECYRECFETCQDLHGTLTPEVARTMCNLAILYHVKARIQDEGESVEGEYLQKADECYQEAMKLSPKYDVSVQYANFLYQQGQSANALLTMLPYLYKTHEMDPKWLVYNGVEQVVLPDHLQYETGDTEEFTIQTDVFADFLAILCYKQLHLVKDAEDCLVHMCESVTCSSMSLNHSLLGYSFLEFNMPEEAAECFMQAACLQDSKELPLTNFAICIYLWIYQVIVAGMATVWNQWYGHFAEVPSKTFVSDLHVSIGDMNNDQEFKTITMTVYSDGSVENIIDDVDIAVTNDQMADSGYDDRSFSYFKRDEPYSRPKNDEEPVTSASILAAVRKRTQRARDRLEGKPVDDDDSQDLLTTIRLETVHRLSARSSKNDLRSEFFESGYSEGQGGDEAEDQWVTHEETVDTPVEILKTLGSSSEINFNILEEDISEETWVTEESESVVTPMAILEALKFQGTHFTRDSSFGIAADPPVHSFQNTQIPGFDNVEDTEEWVTTEEVVATPIEFLQQLQAQSIESQQQPIEEEKESEEEEWVSEEVSVELPKDILEQIRQQQMGSKIPWRTSSVTEDSNDTWVTTEESCEMPKEVMDFLHEQEERHVQQRRPVVENSPSEPYVIPYENSSPSTHGPSSYRSWYNRWSTQRGSHREEETWSRGNSTEVLNVLNGNLPYDDRSSTSHQAANATEDSQENEEVWETWETTEETVDAPPELLAILAQQQQQRA